MASREGERTIVGVAILAAALGAAACVGYWLWLLRGSSVKTSLVVCESVSSLRGSEGNILSHFEHCAETQMQFTDADQCEQGKLVAGWVLAAGQIAKPTPWVVKDGLVLACEPSDLMHDHLAQQTVPRPPQ